LLFCVLLVVVQGRWVPAKLTVTADNAYAVFVGDSQGLKYLGSEWASTREEIFSQPEYYPAGPLGKHNRNGPVIPMYLDEHHALYIVAWSDAVDFQGLLADVVIDGIQISAENPEWQVYPTGFFAQPTDNSEFPASSMPGCTPAGSTPYDRTVRFGQDNTAPPCPAWVQKMIVQADADKLWKTPSKGDYNTEASSHYKQKVTGIAETHRWMWYNSTECADALNAPFETPRKRCEHQEPLIFRIPVSAAQAEPTQCAPSFTGNFKMCKGQCPLRPDGTLPQCATIYDTLGNLRECECCTTCQLVAMPDIRLNYCTGLCKNNNCQQCLPSSTAPINPDDPNGPTYITGCNCLPPVIRTCDVDRCNNKCTGPCPLPDNQCVPDYVDPITQQIINCTCPPTDLPCQLLYNAGTAPTCVGRCKDPETPCKGMYVGDILRTCTCDCCDLVRNLQDPNQNYCLGKCDDTTLACRATSHDPSGGWINGCDCI